MKRISILSILILVLGYAFYEHYSLRDECYGLIEFLKNALLFLVTVIVAVIAIIGSITKFRQTKRIGELLPLFLMVIVFIPVVVHKYSSDPGIAILVFSPSKKLHPSDNHKLKLYSNNQFTLEMNGSDFGCTYYGKYSRINDTIKIQRNLRSLTCGEFGNIYAILSHGTLMPIESLR
jgi:hypothetical protein